MEISAIGNIVETLLAFCETVMETQLLRQLKEESWIQVSVS